jgi:hypothetical protein
VSEKSTIWDVIEALPPELQKEVEDFARFLLEKRGRKTAKKPLFSWAGALRELRDQYTSVALQHAIAHWRAGDGEVSR